MDPLPQYIVATCAVLALLVQIIRSKKDIIAWFDEEGAPLPRYLRWYARFLWILLGFMLGLGVGMERGSRQQLESVEPDVEASVQGEEEG